MIEEVKKKLTEFAKLAEGDKEWEAAVKAFSTDITFSEAAKEIAKVEAIQDMIRELEESNKMRIHQVMNVQLADPKNTDHLIRSVISHYQAAQQVINALRGPKLEDVSKQLDRAIATVKEAKEEAAKAKK